MVHAAFSVQNINWTWQHNKRSTKRGRRGCISSFVVIKISRHFIDSVWGRNGNGMHLLITSSAVNGDSNEAGDSCWCIGFRSPNTFVDIKPPNKGLSDFYWQMRVEVTTVQLCTSNKWQCTSEGWMAAPQVRQWRLKTHNPFPQQLLIILRMYSGIWKVSIGIIYSSDMEVFNQTLLESTTEIPYLIFFCCVLNEHNHIERRRQHCVQFALFLVLVVNIPAQITTQR